MPVRDTSKEAHVELSALSCEAQRLEILRSLERAGDNAVCRKMIAGDMGKPFHAISGRFTELKASGLIDDVDTGRVKWDGRSHANLQLTDKGRAALLIGCAASARPERHPAALGEQGELWR